MRAREWTIVTVLLLCAGTADATGSAASKMDSTMTANLVVCGEVRVITPGGSGPDGFIVYLYNRRSGAVVADEIGEQEPGVYEAIFLDLNNNPVAAVGDVLDIFVVGALIRSPESLVITQEDINAQVARCDLRITSEVLSAVPGVVVPRLVNFPNPFNPRTTIEYRLEQPGRVRLSIYDVAGRVLRVLVDEARDRGNYSLVWEGDDDTGGAVASGTYILRIETEEGATSRKLTVAK